MKVRADIEVSCFSYDGIDAVKGALIEGQKCSTPEMPIKVTAIVNVKLRNICINFWLLL